MASDFEKPNKVNTLFSHEIKEKMWSLPIWQLFWCWRETEPKLKKLWIYTIWDLAKKEKATIKARLWRRWWILHDYANWIDNTKVENKYDDRKCIGASSITKIDTKDRDYILSFYEWFSEELATSLKDRNLAWDIITVHVRYTNFTTKTHQSKLPNKINTSDEIYSISSKLFDELWDKKELNLVWVSISWLSNTKYKQNCLF
jgi:DNA polymerase-4